MGYLTTIMIRNDAMHLIKEDPKGFVEKLLETIDESNCDARPKDIGFKNHCNMGLVHPSCHADDEQLYFHSGNSLVNLNPYSNEFKDLMGRSEYVVNFVKNSISRVSSLVRIAKAKIKEYEKQN